MKNYKVVPSNEDGDFIWHVYELATEQVIQSFYFEEDAMETARFMDKGGGFAGFTPTFMLRSVSVDSTDVNDEFTRVFV